MKISQKQKTENRFAIIRAAVDLISEKGFKATTMRQIAKAAGLGDATIYNYFTTKEAILFGYYEDHMRECIRALKNIDEFHTFSLQEQLQTLFETSLDGFISDREFVTDTFSQVLLRGSLNWAQVKPIRSLFLAAVKDMLSSAAQVEEIPEPVFLDLICQLFMDAYIGVVHYWTADTSQGFSNTSILIDKGLDLACAILRAGIANRVFDLAIFMFKNHILNNLNHFIEPVKSSDKAKKHFMESWDDE